MMFEGKEQDHITGKKALQGRAREYLMVFEIKTIDAMKRKTKSMEISND